jgi:hypothetical protein
LEIGRDRKRVYTMADHAPRQPHQERLTSAGSGHNPIATALVVSTVLAALGTALLAYFVA